MRRRNKASFSIVVIAILAGMGGELHLPLPGLGYVAMLDLVSYGIAIPVILANWGRMGKNMRRSLLWAFAWTAAAMLANLFNFYEMRYWAKCVAVTSSSWAIMAAGYVLLRNYPAGYLWYLVGTGIGGWVALRYFRNGSLEAFATGGEMGGFSGLDNLFEKQIYPSIARGVILGIVLPFFIWWKKLPIFFVIGVTMYWGFWLLFNGGSRSSFGVFSAAAGAGFVVAYGAHIMRKMARNPFVMATIALVSGAIVFGGYKYMATSGMMGDSEKAKYESEFVEGDGAMKNRAGIGHAYKAAVQSFGIGLGGHLRCHSVLGNSLACEGVVGFLFWVYFFLQILWWTSKRMPYSGKYVTFIVLMILTAVWDVLGSPFGTRHKFFMLMTFIALCRDNPYYGVGTLFDPRMIGRMPR